MMAKFIKYCAIFLSLCSPVILFDGAYGPDACFCKLYGEVDDCACKVESVDSFNNLKIFPRLNSLLHNDYFRYWKVNLNKDCPFWKDDSRCSLKDCHVDCDEKNIPESVKEFESNGSEHDKYSKEANEGGGKQCRDPQCNDPQCKAEHELGSLDTTISAESKKAFETWQKHDEQTDNFCELDDERSNDAVYVDLLLNPERYTGYVGASPHRIWHSIYNENCFKPEQNTYSPFLHTQPGSCQSAAKSEPPKESEYKKPEHEKSSVNKVGLPGSPTGTLGSQIEGMCLEKRAFYRMISGLHTSINIHLSAMYYFPDKLGIGAGTWGPNLEQFHQRFSPETTNNEGPQWLKNLYFTYLVELRALSKIRPYLEHESFFTGQSDADADLKEAIKDLLKVLQSFPDHFDESKLFKGDPQEAANLQREFKQHFRNISRIMDCVGCDKCKLWGKLQVTGMGTALKILFAGDSLGPESTLTQEHRHNFKLTRQEIVALFNAFGRLSKSIHEVEVFRKLLASDGA